MCPSEPLDEERCVVIPSSSASDIGSLNEFDDVCVAIPNAVRKCSGA